MRRSNSCWTILVLATSVLWACGKDDGDVSYDEGAADCENPEATRITGHYLAGFEASVFTACGEKEWWVAGAPTELYEEYDALNLGDYAAAYADVCGVVSAPGMFGHLGAYEREITITELFEIRMSTDDDCP